MSDRVAIINEGRLEQVACPRELYENPQTEFVADFIGVANIIRGSVVVDENGSKKILSNGIEFFIPSASRVGKGEKAILVVRPERIRIGALDQKNSFPVTVQNMLYKGTCSELFVSFDNGLEMRIRSSGRGIFEETMSGKKVHIGWNEEETVVLRCQ
jgi:ABC-type Fe3+/spermidine/putrescine transport system ATPase subunit